MTLSTRLRDISGSNLSWEIRLARLKPQAQDVFENTGLATNLLPESRSPASLWDHLVLTTPP
jgi:hypothetical protein